MADNTRKFQKVWDISRQLELVKGESTDGWSGSADVSNITTSTTHLTGATSLSFDKDGTTQVTGTVSKTLDSKNGNLFSLHKIKVMFNLSSIADVASVSLTLGTDSLNNFVWTVQDTDLSAGWNQIDFDADNPTSTNGTELDWYNIDYVAFTVVLDATGDTLTSILLDSIQLFKQDESGGTISASQNLEELGGRDVLSDDAAFTEGTDHVLPAGFIYDDDATLDDGDVGVARVTEDRKVITAGYDLTSDSGNVTVVNNSIYEAVYSQDVTNETNTTINRYIDVAELDDIIIQFIKVGGTDTVTMTIEGSCEDNGTAAASAAYDDISQYAFNSFTAASTAASYTSDVILGVKPAAAFKFINIKTVSSGGSNDADYSIHVIGLTR